MDNLERAALLERLVPLVPLEWDARLSDDRAWFYHGIHCAMVDLGDDFASAGSLVLLLDLLEEMGCTGDLFLKKDGLCEVYIQRGGNLMIHGKYPTRIEAVVRATISASEARATQNDSPRDPLPTPANEGKAGVETETKDAGGDGRTG